MTTGGWVRRILCVAAASLGVIAAPAARAATTTETFSATGFWQLNDANHTAVSVSAVDARRPSATTVFVFVSQQFCDTAADQAVFRSVLANFVAVKPGDVNIQPQLKRASLRSTVPATVVDNRLGTCASPSGIPTTVQQGTFPLTISADWTATGPAVTVQPGVVRRATTATGDFSNRVLRRIHSPGAF